MQRRPAQLLISLPVMALAVGLLGASGVSAASNEVPVLIANGVVDSTMSGYIQAGLARAATAGAPAVVIELDTPGGSLTDMQDIVTAELGSTVPVIVWVAPAGGFAASAGTFITLAGNLAYMAPGTRIGAASPVDSNGGDIGGTEGQKVLNDAIAYIRSIAQTRGRNVDWAASTVASAASASATDAVSLGAVNGIASTLQDVAQSANGKQVTVGGGKTVTLDLANATFTENGPSLVQTIQQLLADPNIAFVLFTIGALALLFELSNPNFVTGIIGGIALILAFIGFGSLPLNVGGLLLLGLGIVLFGVDLTVTNHGLFTAGGLVCFVLGASILYASPSTPAAPDVSVALPLIVVMTVTFGLSMALITYAAMRSRKLLPSPGTVGTGLPIGAFGEVRRPLSPAGSIYAAGEEWSARAANGETLERGTAVHVVGTDGLTLLVDQNDDSVTVTGTPSTDVSAQPAR